MSDLQHQYFNSAQHSVSRNRRFPGFCSISLQLVRGYIQLVSLDVQCALKTLRILVCADILYMNNLQTGSILDYTLAYLGAVLARNREKWDQPSKTGLIEITTSREYYRIYSGFQFVSLSVNCI